ncbi:hypothetical protein DFJ58DRAFT_24018 [Suillus subalutaceus]|uniref:uncharacterized protein n=1 Tax=Suillus subalutaceus TaxID=48586 RepID=UPI001B8651D7|nr:uncharacterized protein DFJ58DRAFT_24018 [Suillus subalutaceus]KAG1870766.1 hypothetical protein DFJ58DRAFT_24018 [Suillus subalutaceus]
MHRILINNHSQAFKQHKIVDIFCSPGECDVTTNVDFALLKESMADLGTSHDGALLHDCGYSRCTVSIHGPISQRNFFTRMGIEIRAAALVRSASSLERKKAIEDGASRLIDPLGMGEQYKVLGAVAKGRAEEGRDGSEVWPFTVIQDSAQQSI